MGCLGEELTMNHHDTVVTAEKAGSAWGAYGVSRCLEWLGFGSWSDVAAFLAAVYSLILIGEWAWKKWKAR